MPATQNVDLAKGRDASGAITKKRFVKLVSGTAETVAQCSVQGENAYGVSLFSVSTAEISRGKGVSVLIDGRAVVEASGAINEGDLIATDNQGRAKVAASGEYILGVCDEGHVTTAGQEISVNLSAAGAKVP